ncbi:response regulator transcription factor [Paucibacter sp. DJ1R-11]|uniref:response regulator transcription factor n=1 Tax=Paucibacter sp. DJ1R-11 TaxID=2893556 RepID=UPI0021E3DB5E|nr:response regulator transcription factor [Paucibacter sp. DJ1R-11]MCV2361924.1 response regulator transcription factor [Paucibacter sp. DJ1R-11]
MKKILIVDDNPDIRALLHATLDLAQSFEIHEAIDGVTAVEIARSLKPDLVLMDIMMPGEFDGLEACRRIKHQAGDGEMAPKVLLISAKPRDQVRQQLEDVGADLFMAKPFGPIQLVECIQALFAPKA